MLFPRLTAEEITEMDSAFYTDMFREDLSFLLPSYDQASSVIRLEPASQNVEQLIEEALCVHHARGFAAAVSEFIRFAAMSITGYGVAYYEITYESETLDKEPVAFHFQRIDPESVLIVGTAVYQKIDPRVAQERRCPKWIHIPRKTVLKLSPPGRWVAEFRQIAYALTVLSRVTLPDFAIPDIARSRSVPVDNLDYLNTQQMAVLAATKRTGWNIRGLSSGKISGYYWFQRYLRFEKLKIQLRNELVNGLNDGLQRAGAKLGFSARIVVSDLPSESDVSAAECELDLGSKVMGEIIKPFLRA